MACRPRASTRCAVGSTASRSYGSWWTMEGMTTVAVLARFDFKPGKENEAERFFQTGSAIVDKQPETTRWYAFRLGPCAYGAFAVFGSEEDRMRCWLRAGRARHAQTRTSSAKRRRSRRLRSSPCATLVRSETPRRSTDTGFRMWSYRAYRSDVGARRLLWPRMQCAAGRPYASPGRQVHRGAPLQDAPYAHQRSICTACAPQRRCSARRLARPKAHIRRWCRTSDPSIRRELCLFNEIHDVCR